MIKPTITRVDSKKGRGYQIQFKYFDDRLKKYKYKKTTYYPDNELTDKQALHEATLYAEKFVKDMSHQTHQAGELDGRKITVREYSEMWLEKIKNEKSHNFYYSAKGAIRLINENLGHLKLRDLNPVIIQDFFNKLDKTKSIEVYIKAKPNFKELLKAHNYKFRKIKQKIETTSLCHLFEGRMVSVNWGKRFSKIIGIPFKDMFDTVNNTHELSHVTTLGKKKILRQMLADAKRKGLVEQNYATADYIEYPKGKKKPIKTMNMDEMSKLYDAILSCDDIRVKTAMMTFFLMGFRRGEVAGLDWDGIDFDEGMITISKSVVYTPGFGYYEKEPKTELSSRTVSAAPELMEQLKLYKEWCIDKGISVDTKVFLSSDGSLIKPDIFDDWLRTLFKKTDIKEHYTLHSLRHSNIAYLISKGVDPVTVAKRAGHARVSTTLDIYSYAFDHVDKEAALLTSGMGKKEETQPKLNINVIPEEKKEEPKIEEIKEEPKKDDSIPDFKKVKAEMNRLGFKTYDEYFDYLEFLEAKQRSKNGPEM